MGKIGWGSTFSRSTKEPLDDNTVYETYAEMMAYATNPNNTAYEGMLLAVISDSTDSLNGVYYIKSFGTESDRSDAEINKLGADVDLSGYATTEALNTLQTQLNTLVSGDVTNAIDNYNEIIAFLDSFNDTETLAGVLLEVKTKTYEYTVASGSSGSETITATAHGCGTNLLVTTYMDNEEVLTSKTISSEGTVTIAWNSTLTSALVIKIVGLPTT